MTAVEIKRRAIELRGSIEMLHDSAVTELEHAATHVIDELHAAGAENDECLVRLREALLAIELTREMRV